MECRYQTPKAIAQYLGVHEQTVRRLSRQGDIPAVKVGGQYRYDLAEVEAKLREQVDEASKRG